MEGLHSTDRDEIQRLIALATERLREHDAWVARTSLRKRLDVPLGSVSREVAEQVRAHFVHGQHRPCQLGPNGSEGLSLIFLTPPG